MYLIRTKKKNKVAHLWNDTTGDTECRMWSTGGITAKSAYKIREFKGEARICQTCTNNIKKKGRKVKFKGNMRKDNVFANFIREEFEKELAAKKASKSKNDATNLSAIRDYKKKHGIDGELTQVQCIAVLNDSKRKPLNRRKVTKKTKRKARKNEGFYDSREWREVRYKALKIHGRQCLCCGSKPPDVVLHVDHIKPRSKYPELELDINNLQILCKDCNLGKSNYDEIDYRKNKGEI